MKLNEILKTIEPDTTITVIVTEIDEQDKELDEYCFNLMITSIGDVQIASDKLQHLTNEVSYIGVSEYGKGLDIGTIREVKAQKPSRTEKVNINQNKISDLLNELNEKDKVKILLALETVCNW